MVLPGIGQRALTLTGPSARAKLLACRTGVGVCLVVAGEAGILEAAIAALRLAKNRDVRLHKA